MCIIIVETITTIYNFSKNNFNNINILHRLLRSIIRYINCEILTLIRNNIKFRFSIFIILFSLRAKHKYINIILFKLLYFFILEKARSCVDG